MDDEKPRSIRAGMVETYPVSRTPLGSLARKIIACVCLCTSATAMLVSWIAIQTTYTHLHQELARRLPRSLEHGAVSIAAWQEARRPDAPLGEADRRALRALLDLERDGAARMLLIDPQGAILAAALGHDAVAPSRATAEVLSHPAGMHDYHDADGVRVMGASRDLANGWRLVVEDPFQRAFAPVMAVVARVFAADLAVILFFGLLGYKITTAALHPIETLSEAARRIAQGQFDHEVPELSRTDELGLLTRTFNDMMRRLRGYQSQIETANERLTERNMELQQAKETFEQLSITDGLTRLHNHRFFQDHLTRELKRVSRTGEPLTMLLIDIDDFKGLNDRFGHAAGDELLTGLAQTMSDTIRESDLLARYGGEEFVVLAANTDLSGAYGLAEKVRTAVVEASFIVDESMRPVRVSVSIGVARYQGNRKAFFVATDRALYRAKAEGKNCVVMDEDEQLA
ncbi:MAG: diguanylate cyclase [Deltaproteobacteria bacterium]|nr:diguanylate cyclase [Deltaproteobacteria bacterium]